MSEELRDNLIYCKDTHSLAHRLYKELELDMSLLEFRRLCFDKIDEMMEELEEVKE